MLTKTSSEDIGVGSLANSITINPNPFSNPTFNNNGYNQLDASCSLTVSVTTVYTFPDKDNDGKIALTLPSDLIVVSSGCTATIGSSTMECSRLGTSVTATHSLTSSVAGMTISITFSNIKNPSSSRPTNSFQILSQKQVSGTYYSIDGITDGFSYNISSLGSITSATVVRDSLNSDNDGLKVNAATNFLFTFTITNALNESDSSFSLTLPSDSDAQFNSSSADYQCSAANCATGASLTCTVTTANRTVLVSDYCSTANNRSCKASSTIVI